MDIAQNGESSKSPRQRAFSPTAERHTALNPHTAQAASGSGRLILPPWDVPPPKHLHASHDLISLLQLDNLYNTYVRPYAEVISDETMGGAGQAGSDDEGENVQAATAPAPAARGAKNKKRRLEKGYQHLIADCIDPTPTGENKTNHSLLPLVGDYLHPPSAPPNLFADPLDLLNDALFDNAKLEQGHREQGYENGQKAGVREAELRRQRKNQRVTASLSLAPDAAPSHPSPIGISSPLSPGQPPAPPQHFPRPPFGSRGTGLAPGTPRGGGPGSGSGMRGTGMGMGMGPGRGGPGAGAGPGGGGGFTPIKRSFDGMQGGSGSGKRGRGGPGPGSRGGSEVPVGTPTSTGLGVGVGVGAGVGMGQGMRGRGGGGGGGGMRGRGGGYRSKTEG